ncbi:GIN domain-containing protein [Moheibacter sediminis]|uniref:Putative auto-transporter adhesin, head GIN domain n=1 Tax=Moheibacter sediminis TaxID=1434700 RepID=A0A1W1Z2U6_9FLAO|nr:DUF2807 domain-containing protein [Moheibacter sediminis]SMC42632.1 Putative auto-transporter adhesin, head GIN domain [Moheibacter sediminis]
MKKLFLTLSAAILLVSCGSGLEGEGAATAKKEFAVEQFTSIEANCNCDITIIPSATSKVVVESHQNLIDNLELSSKRGNLVINEKSNVGEYSLYNVNIYSLAALNEIELNNQARMKISGTLKAEKFKIEANDQSMIEQAYVDFKEFELDISNQTNVNITGTAINLEVSTSDQSIGNLSELQTVEIDFSAKNQSSLSLWVMKDLSGEASDNAQVTYKGDPNKDTKETGQATINKK